jgi:6-phosphogluconate dehydrogenase
MVRRLLRRGHEAVAFDVNQGAVQGLAGEGAVGVASLKELVERLARPRHVWLMLPVAYVDRTIDELVPLLAPGDAIIDGGNTHYHDDIRRAGALAPSGVHYVDVGTSGGVFGLERGYCLMIGGEGEVVRRLDPIFSALAPGAGDLPRTAGRALSSSAEHGYLHCGPVGAGHFVKMVHNGIEYGLMAAYAEGLNVLKHANAGHVARAKDAETTPLEHPEHYRYDFDLAEISELWRRGSVITSWLLDLTADALARSPALSEFGGRVSDSGEGRWTLQAAIDEGVPVHVLSAAVFDRFESRGQADFANKVLSAMRFGFGGHHEKKE